MGIPFQLRVIFCHPFGAGSLLFLSQGLHPWLYPFCPSGLLWGDPLGLQSMVCIQTVARLKPCPTYKNRQSRPMPDVIN